MVTYEFEPVSSEDRKRSVEGRVFSSGKTSVPIYEWELDEEREIWSEEHGPGVLRDGFTGTRVKISVSYGEGIRDRELLSCVVTVLVGIRVPYRLSLGKHPYAYP